jgi:hypothetical protein
MPSTLKIQIKDRITSQFKTIVDCSDSSYATEFNSLNGNISKNYEGVDINIEIPNISE